MKRFSNVSILIITEGDNSEPNFFGTLLGNTHRLADGSVVSLWPEPKKKSDKSAPTKRIPGNPKTSANSNQTTPPPSGIPGIPPLKWVLAAKSKIASDTFSEAWAVFDHDNHPALEEAFRVASETPKVNLAFSSRSFEYYMLLHFEQIYYEFQETECKGSVICGLKPFFPQAGDCNGHFCINGYARSKQYWIESKKGDVEENPIWKQMIRHLEFGIYNSNWLRKESECLHPNVPVWDRNPYVTTDALVKRLTGTWLEVDVPHIFKEGLEIKLLEQGIIQLTNVFDRTVTVPEGCIIRYDFAGSILETLGERKLMQPSMIASVDLAQYINVPCFFAFEAWGSKIKFILG
jgi:hypothetical protein